MNLNKYQELFENFLKKRDEHPEEQGRKVPDDINKLVIGGTRTVKAAIMVFDIADSKKVLEELGKERYLEWLGITLHCLFHCVDDYNGNIDKYTGDGAMVSFSFGSDEDRCKNALNCAIGLSKIIEGILNPYFLSNDFKVLNIRIGIDFGPTSIERIGKKDKTQLILIGTPTNNAKIFEERGKNLKFKHNCTICIGYDVFSSINLTKYKCDQGYSLYFEAGTIEGESFIDSSNPYKFYEFWCRRFF